MKALIRMTLIATALGILLIPLLIDDVLRPVFSARSAEILFTGDIMLDRAIRTHGERDGYERLTRDLVPLFATVHGAIGNLEGPITARPSMSENSLVGDENNMRFTFSFDSLAALAPLRFLALSLGNNHTDDFGTEGIRSTVAVLHDARIAAFGAPGGERVARLAAGRVRFSLVSFNEFNGDTASSTAALIHAERTARLPVIVFAHWGEEYRAEPTEIMRAWAHHFVDAGAALVIGTHPHVIGERERYRNSMIYYSLGNFIFDQYFSVETRCGLLVRATITPQGVTKTEEHYVRMAERGRTILEESCAHPESSVLRTGTVGLQY